MGKSKYYEVRFQAVVEIKATVVAMDEQEAKAQAERNSFVECDITDFLSITSVKVVGDQK